jgi:hypothetical protein
MSWCRRASGKMDSSSEAVPPLATSAEGLLVLERMCQLGGRVAEAADMSGEPVFSVRSVALSLLVRSLSHARAVHLLLGQGLIVEARTLVRCCYENLFWIRSLAKRGEEFLREVELDDAASRMKLARDWSAWIRVREEADPRAERHQAFYEAMRAQHQGAKQIRHSQAAEDGGVSKAYLAYRQLSSDSAHPSARSLSRYLEWPPGAPAPFPRGDALATEQEVLDTLHLLGTALLSVIVSADRTVGRTLNSDTQLELALAVDIMGKEASRQRT